MMMTNERLHEIIVPVWEKHPGTRPEGLSWNSTDGIGRTGAWRFDYGEGNVRILPQQATLLCEAQMTRWLHSQREVIEITDGTDPWPQGVHLHVYDPCHDYQCEFPTMLEALAAACLTIPKSPTRTNPTHLK